MFNAMTMPGNFIFVFRGLLDNLRSDDELASVLAHEIGHRLALHEQATAGEKFGEILAANERSTDQDVLETLESVHTVGKGFTTLRYSKDKEREADLIGMFLMADAGYNPDAAATVWASQAARESSGASDFFDTHPLHQERYNTAMQLLPQARQRYFNSRNSQRTKTPQIKHDGPSPQQAFELDQAHRALTENDFRTAEKIANSLVRRSPSLTLAHNVLGIAKIRQGQAQEAAQVFSKALKMEPTNPTLIYNSACANALQGRTAEALKLLEQSFELDPQLVETASDDEDLASLSNDPRFSELLAREYVPKPPTHVGGNTFSLN
jgi:predicted Zn-dependent protease